VVDEVGGDDERGVVVVTDDARVARAMNNLFGTLAMTSCIEIAVSFFCRAWDWRSTVVA
jgi:hypothetical protein